MSRRISNKNTYVVFIDNDDSYIRDVLARFEEVNEYNIKIYSRSKDFFDDYTGMDHDDKRIFIVFVSTTLGADDENKPVSALDVLKRIKDLNSYAEVIIYSDNDDINIVSSAFNYGVYTFIKKTENITLRIENNIKGIISQRNFLLNKKESKLYTKVFLFFLALVSIVIIIIYMLFPEWFVS